MNDEHSPDYAEPEYRPRNWVMPVILLGCFLFFVLVVVGMGFIARAYMVGV